MSIIRIASGVVETFTKTNFVGVLNMQLKGYRRPDGRVGVRNHILIISSVVCANRTVEMIAAQVPGAIPLTHPHGCAQLGIDKDQTARVLGGFGANPNVACALVVGLGCETVQPDIIAEVITKTKKTVESITIQQCGGTLKAVACGAELAAKMAATAAIQEREEIAWSEIVVATECGGSDTTSGLAANPACGYASDLVVEAGGTVILSETMELVGAEHLLAERSKTEAIGQGIYHITHRAEQGAMALGEDIRGGQPTPGNIAGGLTTIEEKSLGCIYKAGSTKINEVVDYACAPTQKGLVVMDTPGHDVESVTGMVAGGAQLVVFTTGQGTPTGCPIAPVIKVTGNFNTALTMADNIDINAGEILQGNATKESIGNKIYEEYLQVINGKQTKAELFGQRDFAINRIGPTL